MKNINIGIQGGIGSFSEEAAKIFCKNYKINNFNIDYLISSTLTHLHWYYRVLITVLYAFLSKIAKITSEKIYLVPGF